MLSDSRKTISPSIGIRKFGSVCCVALLSIVLGRPEAWADAKDCAEQKPVSEHAKWTEGPVWMDEQIPEWMEALLDALRCVDKPITQIVNPDVAASILEADHSEARLLDELLKQAGCGYPPVGGCSVP